MKKSIGVVFVAVGSLALLFLPKFAARRSEESASQNLRLVVAAEKSYFQKHGRFAPLQELGDSAAIPKELADGELSGYRFEVKLNEAMDRYTLTVTSPSGQTREVWSDPNRRRGVPGHG